MRFDVNLNIMDAISHRFFSKFDIRQADAHAPMISKCLNALADDRRGLFLIYQL